MTLTPGTRLGSYEIVGPIGVGGMGEVYRAKDTRLPRDAAIKVSAEQFNERFAGEAHAIASLNHPNIMTLYDVGPDYLVMELVEGPTLAERIQQGPLPLDEAIGIARQIADALDYAHERGIVHRDLKPGNVKIRPDGVVKVLDFGLAKIGVGQTVFRSDESPTMAVPRTEAGTIVGTVAYMSPEQVKGQAVDKRADIWAFGCVVYEMLTGTRPHSADTSQETIASILRDEPDLQKVPAQARRLLKRCLEKDPQKRLRHVGDAMALIDEPPSGEQISSVADAAPSPQTASANKWGLRVAVGIVGLAALALVAWAPWRNQTNTGNANQVVSLEVGETEAMRFFYGGAMAVSPDGRWMVFPAVGQDGVSRYWLRSLETVEARPLPGTETAYVPASWSADSRYVIFSVIGGRKLSKVDIQGGPPQTLVDEFDFTLNGLTTTKDVILFGTTGTNPLFRLPATGGKPVPVTALADGDAAHRFPQFLPDGKRFLYLRLSSTDPAQSGIYIGSIDARPEEQDTRRLMPANRQAYYSAASAGGPGYLVLMRDSTLLAQPFDPVTAELSGEPIPIAEGVDSFTPVSYGLFAVSDTGVLVYRKGAGSSLKLAWLDASGNTVGTAGDSNVYNNAAASPDGTRIAASLGLPGSRDLWIIDTQRNVTSRFTFDTGNEDNPIWSPDSKHIVFMSNRGGRPQLYIKPADGSGEERRVTEEAGIPTSWSKDGRYVLFTSPATANSSTDIFGVSDPRIATADSKPFPVLTTSFNEAWGQFSPDGRWVAYASNETNPVDVYVRPFSPDGSSTTAAKWQISRGFGTAPRWRSDGKQLFYVTANTFGLMAVDVDTTKGFQALTTRRLFTAPPPLLPTGWNLSPDDKRFLFVTSPNGGRTAPFTVVLNWAAMLKK